MYRQPVDCGATRIDYVDVSTSSSKNSTRLLTIGAAMRDSLTWPCVQQQEQHEGLHNAMAFRD